MSEAKDLTKLPRTDSQPQQEDFQNANLLCEQSGRLYRMPTKQFIYDSEILTEQLAFEKYVTRAEFNQKLNKLEFINTYTFDEDSATTTVWSLPSDADYLGLSEIYIVVDLTSNLNGVTERPYLNYWDRVSNSRVIMCQLCPCWAPVQTSPASTMNRCIYNGVLVNGTMFPVIARYGNSRQYPYSINDNLATQTYRLSRNTPYLNEIQLQCNGAGIGAGTEVTIYGVKYYG